MPEITYSDTIRGWRVYDHRYPIITKRQVIFNTEYAAINCGMNSGFPGVKSTVIEGNNFDNSKYPYARGTDGMFKLFETFEEAALTATSSHVVRKTLLERKIRGTFDWHLAALYLDLFHKGVWQKNKRTGHDVLALTGTMFTWNMDEWPISNMRKMYPGSAAAELAWFLSGTRDSSWIKTKSSIWSKFEDSPGRVETAYGYVWKEAFGVDQVEQIVSQLFEDPTSRQAVLMSWHPAYVGKGYKNIACPYSAVFNILDNKLNCFLTLRSSDAYLGLPYDMMTYTLLSHAILSTLKAKGLANLEIGELVVVSAHTHIYDNQLKAIFTYLQKQEEAPVSYKLNLAYTIEEVKKNPDQYVSEVANLSGYNIKLDKDMQVGVVV